MGLGELLDRVRGLYVTALIGEAEARRGPDVSIQCESALCDENGAVVCEGVLGLPLRVDLAVLAGGEAETHRFRSDRLLSFAPITFAWEGLCVRLGPFRWDCLDFRIPAPAREDWSPLVGWFWRWFDAETEGQGGTLGVVHFLSDPEPDGNVVRFQADLGSAPVEAFEELLDAVAALGVSEVLIGNLTDSEGESCGS